MTIERSDRDSLIKYRLTQADEKTTHPGGSLFTFN